MNIRYPLLALSLVVITPQLVRAQVGERGVLVFVDNLVSGDPKLKGDVGAMTSGLCTALAKDTRLDVMCAPDVAQILGVAAASMMIGGGSPAADSVMKRLEAVKFVVSGSLTVRNAEVVMTLSAGPPAAGADPSALFSDAPILKIEETSPFQQMKLLDTLPAAATRITKALLLKAPLPLQPPMPPPAPLK